MAKKDNNYFKMFMDIAADAITAATQLKETINNYDPERFMSKCLRCMKLNTPRTTKNIR